MSNHALANAAEVLKTARCAMAFTGAGISVESGIPPFRGPGGVWSKYDPDKFEKGYFKRHPEEVWPLLKEIFFDMLGRARPNPAHLALAELEAAGKLAGIVTQNIDSLHQAAGSRVVHEYHGSTRRMRCLSCLTFFDSAAISLKTLPPPCPACGGLLKPDFVFFGEGIPSDVHAAATDLAKQADVCLVIGTGGEVIPAGRIPHVVKQHGGTIIEINLRDTAYTYNTTDYFLEGKAGTRTPELVRAVLG
ncbi:Silent information regulator protein Sir2 [Pseudodesulfovibrio mercurii]|uniref:protein acetyllysine N-acetyltransferase n=1 Tax=Pseudodesulfovibrio mercurii TaxID=641491 RepID=F0JGY9_9BACT|nr:NAD-dependent deacylase [Pseudodesulfovibrio mercurii]EGB15179.1 Silent information regulator protein Sir2 [Pseudodesulfovibrio mercurii]